MITLTTNTWQLEHELVNILIFNCANKDIIVDIYTDGDFMIGWMIGQLIFWVGIITIITWSLSKCAVI